MTYCFVGCDMGGWHTTGGDALAACWWNGEVWRTWSIPDSRAFYPVNQRIGRLLEQMHEADARLVIAIDAALAWPVRFAELVRTAPKASHLPTFRVTRDIDNPYLYRETERYIRNTYPGVRVLTASGDKFGNNTSKAQGLVSWFATQLPALYRPPFDEFAVPTAVKATNTLIEAYPAASMKSSSFQKLRWFADDAPLMSELADTNLGDAQRCAVTAICYAKTIGLLDSSFPDIGAYPDVCIPNDAEGHDDSYNTSLFGQEGWIFAPKIDLASAVVGGVE